MCYEYSVKWLRTVCQNVLMDCNYTIYVRYNAVFVGHKNRRSAEHFRISTLLHNAFYMKVLGKLCHNLVCGVPQES